MTELIKKVDVSEGKRGLWRIERFTVDERGAQVHNMIAVRDARMTGAVPRSIVPGRYTRLWHDDEVIMSDTPAEMRELAGGITPLTEEAWLKRGVGGPPSVLFGKQRLYPIGHLKAWLHAKLSERHPAYSPKDFL